ncbi:MAG TPA: hypothetical protein DCK95_08175 [Anaerolineaceae bacterium]|nr:hypothetical protein [Anaerolineaceae bacterium]
MKPHFQCPLDRQKTNRLFYTALVFASLFLSIALAVYVYRGFYSRYWADDYCHSATLQEYGIARGVLNSYNNWSNRFSAIFFVGISELFGDKAISFLPGLVIALTVLIYAYLFHLLFLLKKCKVNFLVSFLISQIFTFFLLLMSPNLFQSIYWRAGMISYFAPLIFLGLAFVILCVDLTYGIKKYKYVIFFLLSFVMGGFSETFTVFQIGIWCILWITTLIFVKGQNKDKLKKDFIPLILGALLSLVIVLMAPGNFVRLNQAHTELKFTNLIPLSLKYGWDFVYDSIKSFPVPNFLLFAQMSIIGYHTVQDSSKFFQSKNTARNFFIFLFLFSYILIVCVAAPSVFTMQTYPEERAWMLGRFVTVLTIIVTGFSAGILSHRWMDRVVDTCLISIIILLLLSIYPLKGAWAEWQQLPQWQAIAQAWDERHADILKKTASGETSLIVPAFDSIGSVAELTADPHYWVNVCAAEYYGLEEITALEVLP